MVSNSENQYQKEELSITIKKYTIYFTLFSTANNKKFKLLEYFEPHTQKWKLLHWLSGDLSYPPIIKEESFLSLTQALGIIKKLRSCDASCLKNHFNCSHTTIRIYLKILRNQKKIRLSNHPIYINNYTDNKTKLLLSDDLYKLISRRIKVEFGQDQYFAKFLGVNKSTFSAWKLKKNKLPFFILKETCKTLGIDINYALRNIIETDREIAEII